MRNAMRVTVSAFGAVVGLAGLEHGIGEVLQGNVAPEGMMILSWPGSELFRILAGEPAMTIVPNFLVTGILAIVFSLAFLVWATLFVERKNGGLVLLALSIILLLVGGGFGPPMFGIIVGLAAVRINAPGTGCTHPSAGVRGFLSRSWPWYFGASLAAWLLLLPGSILIDHFWGVSNPELFIPIVVACVMGFMLLTIVAGSAHDSTVQP